MEKGAIANIRILIWGLTDFLTALWAIPVSVPPTLSLPKTLVLLSLLWFGSSNPVASVLFSLLVFMSNICPLPFQLPILCCRCYLLSHSLCSWWSMPLKKKKKNLYFYFSIILGGRCGNHKCSVHQLAESPCLPLNCDRNMMSFSKSPI